jgi:NTE family protein
MASQALVLGGGGSVGIAWESGVLKGLADAGLDLSGADLIVGTSAGSVVGAQLALGQTPEQMVATQIAESDGQLEQAMRFDPQTFMAITARWGTIAEMNQETQAAIGALALSAPTIDEAIWLRVFEATLNGVPWPERRLLVTAVNAESGEFVAWDRTAGAPLARAVASSCTVPGLFPPVTINGARYIDGGVRSGTNADLAKGYDTVVIIAPIGGPGQAIGQLAQRQIESETATLRAAGATVQLLLPDAEALSAFGPNLMDVTRRAVAAQAGINQGQAAAEALRGVWSS